MNTEYNLNVNPRYLWGWIWNLLDSMILEKDRDKLYFLLKYYTYSFPLNINPSEIHPPMIVFFTIQSDFDSFNVREGVLLYYCYQDQTSYLFTPKREKGTMILAYPIKFYKRKTPREFKDGIIIPCLMMLRQWTIKTEKEKNSQSKISLDSFFRTP